MEELRSEDLEELMQEREAAMESLHAPVHQKTLQEYPDLMQQTRSATEEVQDRKEPKVDWWIPACIVFGIVWVAAIFGSVWVAVSGGATSANQWDFRRMLPFMLFFVALALPGVAVAALGLWGWRVATINREVLLRSMKETVGTVEDLRTAVHRSHTGDAPHTTTAYHVTVLFEADDAKMGTRVMALNAKVAHRLRKGMKRGDTVGIRYAAEDPRIALIQGELI